MAPENAPAQDIASVGRLLGGDSQAIVPRCTARAPEFLLPLWTPGRAEFEKPIFEDAVRGVGQGQSEVAAVRGGCHAFGSQPVFDLPARVPVGRDEGSRSGLRGDAQSAAARP